MKTAIRTRTQEEWDELKRLSGHGLPGNCWSGYGKKTCVDLIQCGSKKWYNNNGYRIISLDEWKTENGHSEPVIREGVVFGCMTEEEQDALRKAPNVEWYSVGEWSAVRNPSFVRSHAYRIKLELKSNTHKEPELVKYVSQKEGRGIIDPRLSFSDFSKAELVSKALPNETYDVIRGSIGGDVWSVYLGHWNDGIKEN